MLVLSQLAVVVDDYLFSNRSEVNAVDAEHTKNITNDHWRISMVDRSLANPESVYNRFTTGLRRHDVR